MGSKFRWSAVRFVGLIILFSPAIQTAQGQVKDQDKVIAPATGENALLGAAKGAKSATEPLPATRLEFVGIRTSTEVSPSAIRLPPTSITPRFYNAWFKEGGRANRYPALLETDREYTLYVSVARKRPDSPVMAEKMAATQQQTATITSDIPINVQLYCSVCEDSLKIRQLILPQGGDNATVEFPIKPTVTGDGKILLSLFYKNAKYSDLELPIRVGPEEDLVIWEKQKDELPKTPDAPKTAEVDRPRIKRDVAMRLYYLGESVRVSLTRGQTWDFETALSKDDLKKTREQLWLKLQQIMNETGSKPIKFTGAERANLPLKEETLDAILLQIADIGYHFYERIVQKSEKLREKMLVIKNESLAEGQTPRVTITTDNFAFPWALINDEPVDLRDKTYKKEGFWGLRYIIEQSFYNIGGDISNNRITNKDGMNVLMGVYNAEAHQPRNQADAINIERYKYLRQAQIDWFEDLKPRVSTNVSKSERDILKQLATSENKYKIIYFYTHAFSGTRAVKMIDESGTSFETVQSDSGKGAGIRLTPSDETPPLRPGEIKASLDAPFVFINSCESGAVLALSTDNFVGDFLEKGAKAVLVTETTMWQNFAMNFAGRLFEKFFMSEDLGRSLFELRKEYIKEFNPFPLFYTLYGDSTTGLEKVVNFKHTFREVSDGTTSEVARP